MAKAIKGIAHRDFADHPIMMLDPEGNYVKNFGKGVFRGTHTLCVTPMDTLLCVDVADHVLRELSKDGELHFHRPESSMSVIDTAMLQSTGFQETSSF